MKSMSINRLPIKLMNELPKLQLQSHRNQRSLPRINSLERYHKRNIKEHIPHIDKILNKQMKCYTNITEPAEQIEAKYSVIQIQTNSIVGKTQLLKPRQKLQHNKSSNNIENNISKSIKSQVISPKVELVKTLDMNKTNVYKLPMIQPPQKLVRVRKEVVEMRQSEVVKRYPPGLQFQFPKSNMDTDKNRRKNIEKKGKDRIKQNRQDSINRSILESWQSELVYKQNKDKMRYLIQKENSENPNKGILQQDKIQRFELKEDDNSDLFEYIKRKQREVKKQKQKQQQKQKQKKQKLKQSKLIKKQSKSKMSLSKRQFQQVQIKINQINEEDSQKDWDQYKIQQNIDQQQRY